MSANDPKVSAGNAILISPWAVVPVVALALKGGPHLDRLELFASGICVGVLFGVPLAYVAVLIVGYPAYRLLKAAGILNGWNLCGVGGIVAGLGGLAVVGPEAVVLCAVSGLAVALAAWVLIRKGA